MLLSVSLSCNKDLQFDDPRVLTSEEAFRVPGAGVKLGNSAIVNALSLAYSGSFGAHFLLMCDQSSSTNRFNEFWDFAQEPRLSINNSDTYNGYGVVSSYYSAFYQSNLDANQIVKTIKGGSPIIDATQTDRTLDALGVAYLAKGISLGYLGALYDRGIIVEEDTPTELPEDFPNSYKEMVVAGVKYLDSAIAVANRNSNFQFDFIPGQVISKTDFVAFVNAMAGRLLASIPRDKSEAKALGNAHWQRVYDYASKGVKSDLLNTYVQNGFYHGTLDWNISLLSDGAGYLPVDIKVAWLADNSGTHPKYYPATGVLPPVTTDDKRFFTYFGYDPDFGFLRSDRNRGLFTNYYRKRWDNAVNTVSEPGSVAPLFLAEECRLLMAEAKLYLNDLSVAAAILNDANARRKTLGQLADVQASEDAIRHTLHYEYAIEIDAAGGVLPVFGFMRRNDLLIGGTPTELPIPSQQLDVLKQPNYSFGGKSNMGSKGKYGEISTAADVGWKKSE